MSQPADVHRAATDTPLRVLGIDPGLRITGYGCIEVGRQGVSLVEGGVFRFGRALNAGERDEAEARVGDVHTVSARLAELDRDFRVVLDRLRPDLVAVESLFAHYKHPATAIVMGHARGVLLLAIRQMGMELMELKPTMVKKSISGNGLAKKAQVQSAVRAVLGLATTPEPADMADALAVAICASRRRAEPSAIMPTR
ncbi:MAG TPA: crossover junction endodeoxyribonuclease RuvC [Phycisphaerales bacterium]